MKVKIILGAYLLWINLIVKLSFINAFFCLFEIVYYDVISPITGVVIWHALLPLYFKFNSQVCKGFAKYEKAEHELLATVSSIENSIFGENSSTKALICESNDQPIDFAVYFFNYSTWQGKNGLYLEDLYVSHSERGSGAGKLLLKYLEKLAAENDCGRFE